MGDSLLLFKVPYFPELTVRPPYFLLCRHKKRAPAVNIAGGNNLTKGCHNRCMPATCDTLIGLQG
jgi:hypothetical protein